MKPFLSFASAERSIFYLLLAANLLPVWAFHFFLTCDGPCHLHNSKILLDFWRGGDIKAFYDQWLYINARFEPNWFGHAFMMLLQGLHIPGYLAEKALQTLYVLGFGLGLRYLVRQINPAALFLSSLGLLFTHHYVFQMGFYNYSCSLAALFWVTGYWLHIRHDFTAGRLLVLAAGFIVLYFCHPVGLLYSFLLIGCLSVGAWWRDLKNREAAVAAVWKKHWQNGAFVVLAALPVIVLFAEYLFFKGFEVIPYGESKSALFQMLRENRALLILDASERWWAVSVSVACALLLVLAAIAKFKTRSFSWTDVLFVAFLFTVWLYFNQPRSFAGGGVTPMRLVLLPYLILLLWLASVGFAQKIQKAVLAFSVIVAAGLLIIRFPHYKMANEAAMEYASCGAVIPDKSTVLPISFNHHGQIASGRYVSEIFWLFVHTGDYVSENKSMVLLGNYEAHTRNFPLIWKDGRNPFLLLEKEGTIMENQPPHADILGLPAKTGGAAIDYVVTFCKDQRFYDHPFGQDIGRQLDQGYDLIFTSKNNLAKVFKRKGL